MTTPRELLDAAIQAGAPAEGWVNIDLELDDDEACPIHGPQDTADGNCWACHRAACLADPESCESW